MLQCGVRSGSKEALLLKVTRVGLGCGVLGCCIIPPRRVGFLVHTSVMSFTWGRPWSLPPFGPVSCFASLDGGIFHKCAISPLTTIFLCGEMGVFSFAALSWLFCTFSLSPFRVTRFLLSSSSPTFQLYDFCFRAYYSKGFLLSPPPFGVIGGGATGVRMCLPWPIIVALSPPSHPPSGEGLSFFSFRWYLLSLPCSLPRLDSPSLVSPTGFAFLGFP
jgi:hypothetical protein